MGVEEGVSETDTSAKEVRGVKVGQVPEVQPSSDL